MITVKRLIEQLKSFDTNALAYAYEGEINAVVIVKKEKNSDGLMEQIGYVDMGGMKHE